MGVESYLLEMGSETVQILFIRQNSMCFQPKEVVVPKMKKESKKKEKGEDTKDKENTGGRKRRKKKKIKNNQMPSKPRMTGAFLAAGAVRKCSSKSCPP